MRFFNRKPQLFEGGKFWADIPKISFQSRPVSTINSGHTNIYIRIYGMGDIINRNMLSNHKHLPQQMLTIYDIWLHSVNIIVLGEFLPNRQHLQWEMLSIYEILIYFPHWIRRPPTWLLRHRRWREPSAISCSNRQVYLVIPC